MVPAPVERSELPGHRQQIGKSAALSVGRSPALSQRCGRCGSERSAEFGSVNQLALPSRARARRRRIPARSEADRPAPAGWAALRLLADVDSSFSRNCCWQIRRRTMALGRSAPMLTSASPGRAAAMVPAPVERSQLPGHRQQIGKSAALTVGRSPALSQRCGRCGSERSAEFGSVNRLRCPRARIIGKQGDC